MLTQGALQIAKHDGWAEMHRPNQAAEGLTFAFTASVCRSTLVTSSATALLAALLAVVEGVVLDVGPGCGHIACWLQCT